MTNIPPLNIPNKQSSQRQSPPEQDYVTHQIMNTIQEICFSVIKVTNMTLGRWILYGDIMKLVVAHSMIQENM